MNWSVWSDKMAKPNGFTLVELMIVVSILGIMAAIVLPTFAGNSLMAKESVAMDNLRTVRSQIELYKLQHNGLRPGYYINPIGATVQASAVVMNNQFTQTTSVKGTTSGSQAKSATYPCGPYMIKKPSNPFNGFTNIKYVAQGADFAAAAAATTDAEQVGWLYKKETGEFKLNWVGTDSKGVNYTEY